MLTFTLQAPPNGGLSLFNADLEPQPFSSYDSVVTAIKTLGLWARVQHTVWLVASDSASAAQVRDHIWTTSMHAGDFLLVMRVTKEWGAYNFDENVVKWLAGVKF